MIKLFFVSFVLLLQVFTINAQVFPLPGAKLHYRVIPFTLPVQTNASQYSVSVAQGNYVDETLFKKNITVKQNDSSTRIVIQVPSFATDYTWQWSCKKNGKTIYSTLYHFATLKYPFTDSQGKYSYRMRVTKRTDQYKDAAILVDCTRTMYDINGNPIWFLPESHWPDLTQGIVQDLKITKDGTFTFIYLARAFEIDYNANILTFISTQLSGAANNDVLHHEFIKMKNGNFMSLGREFYLHKYEQYKNTSALNAKDSADMYRLIEMGTILELNPKGNLVWQWKSSDYFSNSDLAYRLNDRKSTNVDFHMNAFSFNFTDSCIYLGFRDIDRILKIHYPNGVVENSFGQVYTALTENGKNNLFCYQHSIQAVGKNSFYLYNNNACNTPSTPEIIQFSESRDVFGLKGLTKVWKHEFTNHISSNQKDEQRAGQGRTGIGNRGGNIMMVDDSTFFVSLNSPFSELHILNKHGYYFWSSILEAFNKESQKWVVNPTYRSSFVSYRQYRNIFSLTPVY